MAGKIPATFIDELVARVDIVDVIDRRVPLTRKGREFQACCPFHEETTPSFTVSPGKQFYHCFGCGAHGTAIGFLMDYANLDFVAAVEELANRIGLQVPRETRDAAPVVPGESVGDFLRIVEQANSWFQQQLRTHPDARQAVEYLKNRGLDGKTAAAFGIGFAPHSRNDLLLALGTTPQAQQQLVKTGLITQKDNPNQSSDAGFYDRFRSRIIFPIEDHRGRVVGFGGRTIGAGEPKYLNSPETSWFHKGAELYGLHRARRSIGAANQSIVVEGYMDVVSLARYGVENVVATLGTATTRTHLQRLFRLAPEVVFCFDGDRGGRAAAWKALQVVLSEMHDGRQAGFLFLPDGEDPDSIVRTQGQKAFLHRVEKAVPMPEFLFKNLTTQVDMTRLDGKARLVSLAGPLIARLPAGALKDMMFSRLSALSGLAGAQLGGQGKTLNFNSRIRNRRNHPARSGQISPLAFATSLLLQNPALALSIDNFSAVRTLRIQGAEVLIKMLECIRGQPEHTTARLLELFRDSAFHGYLQRLAMRENFIDEDALEAQFKDTINRLLQSEHQERGLVLLEKSRQSGLDADEKAELLELLSDRIDNSRATV